MHNVLEKFYLTNRNVVEERAFQLKILAGGIS